MLLLLLLFLAVLVASTADVLLVYCCVSTNVSIMSSLSIENDSPHCSLSILMKNNNAAVVASFAAVSSK